MNDALYKKTADELAQMEIKSRQHLKEPGTLTEQSTGAITWHRTHEDQAVYFRWEAPIEGCKYLISVDTMSGAEKVTGTNEHDNHSVLVWRAAYVDQYGDFYPLMLVCRIIPPCQWDTNFLIKWVRLLSLYYGGATVAAEATSAGVVLLNTLNDLGLNLYQRPEIDKITQKTTKKLGWYPTEDGRRAAVDKLQEAVREQSVVIYCSHVVGELMNLIVNKHGKVEAAGSKHDDDSISTAIGIACLPAAHIYPKSRPIVRKDPNLGRWKVTR